MGYHGLTYAFYSAAYISPTDLLTEVESYPWYTTAVGSSTTNVPVPPTEGYPVSIAGRNYMIDTSFEPYRREAFRHKSLQPQRQSLHFTNIPDDGTVSTEGLWRREMRDWSLGSGQTYLDRKGSADNRFAHSKGVDPWSQWQLSLLPDVKLRYTASHGATKAIHVAGYVYIIDGVGNSSGTVKFTTNYSTYTTLAGSCTITGVYAGTYSFGGTPLDICTDGYTVYVLTTTGVWRFYRGTATPIAGNAGYFVVATDSTTTKNPWTAISGFTLTGIIAYVGGRLIMALNSVNGANNASSTGSIIYDLSVGPHVAGNGLGITTPERLYIHPSLSWKWTGIAQGSANLYFSGYNYDGTVADRGSIFRSSITSSTSNAAILELNYPVEALPMTTGEYPTAMRGYLNYIFIGTNKGIRMCEALNLYDPTGNAGDLKSGPLLPTIIEQPTQPVTAICGDDRYLYWAWNNYDTLSSGLGRLDLTTFIDTLAPAYASDLMVNGQGTNSCTWLDWDPISNTPLMSMSAFTPTGGSLGNYVYTGDPVNCVSSGWVDSGLITYGIPDFKNAVKIDCNVQNLVGTTSNSSVQFEMSTDGDTPTNIFYYNNTTSRASNFFSQEYGEQYDIVTTLTASVSGSTKTSPVLNRWCLKALPGIPAGTMISAVIMLYEPFEMEGSTIFVDPYEEYEFLDNLRQSQTVVTYVEGTYSTLCTVDQLDFLPERRRDVQLGGYHADIVVYLKTVSG